MSDHLALCADRLITTENLQSLQVAESEVLNGEIASQSAKTPSCAINIDEGLGSNECEEDKPLLQMRECRICQDEDSVQNLENPCACNGSLKYAHRSCLQQWCNEKGDINCEICHRPYQSGYTAPPLPPPIADDAAIDISEIWTISERPLDLHDPRNMVIVAAEQPLLEVEYDYARRAAFFRSAALILMSLLMALLLLRHALLFLNGGEGEDEDDVSAAAFSVSFLLRVVGFLIPCYIMAWAISILQRQRQRRQDGITYLVH